MYILDLFLSFLRGPLLVFALAIAFFGMLRIGLLHLAIIVQSLYNAGSKGLSKKKIVEMFIINFSTAASAFRVGLFTLLKKGSLFFGLVLLPLFTLDHILIVKKVFGFEYPGLSAFAGALVSLIVIGYLGRKSLISFRSFVRSNGDGVETAFWSLMFILFGSGVLAGSIDHIILLKLIQIMHGLTGILLLMLLPFIPARNYLIYPLVILTRHLCTWALPAKTIREETLTYFNKLKSEL